MRSNRATRWLLAALTLGACDRAAPPEPVAAAPESGASRAPAAGLASADAASAPLMGRPGVGGGGVAPVAYMPPGTACPPYYFLNNVNYSANPSFETGVSTMSGPPNTASAATGWKMHTSNSGAPITTARVATTAPGPSGSRMMAVFAGGNEGGIYQNVRTPAKVMFSAWVWVNTGKVVIGTHAMVDQGPYAWSTKTHEWEQLRVCTDGSYPPGWFFIYNQNPTGGSFYVDRVEIRAIP
jgi:hypothetical protein